MPLRDWRGTARRDSEKFLLRPRRLSQSQAGPARRRYHLPEPEFGGEGVESRPGRPGRLSAKRRGPWTP